MTGVLCGAVNSLCHEEREASKHEIREEAVMQLSAPMAPWWEVWGGSPRHVTGQKTPKQGLPHRTTPPVTNLQLQHMNSLFPVSPPPSPLLLLLITCEALQPHLYTLRFLILFAFPVFLHYNTVTPNTSHFFLMIVFLN